MGQLPDCPASDADLVREALLGAREPFAELVRRHQRTATALAARVLGSDDLAALALTLEAVETPRPLTYQMAALLPPRTPGPPRPGSSGWTTAARFTRS